MVVLSNLKSVDEDEFEVEYEFESLGDTSRISNLESQIEEGMKDLDADLEQYSKSLEEFEKEIELHTNRADKVDYAVAVSSGIISGLIDVFFVEDLSLDKANEWGDEKVDNFVLKIAKKCGYKGNDISGAIKFLEEKYKIPGDKATNSFGGGRQHHLRDFSHHPNIFGLIFSLITQFTGKVIGTDENGNLKIAELDPSQSEGLIGESFAEKIYLGIVTWAFHMISDIAGSSTSRANDGIGTGLPGPIVSLLKLISSLPFFKKNDKEQKDFSVWISKLFNGTLFATRDENGNLSPKKFDFRTELGIAKQLSKQAIPVIINECIVKSFYFIRCLYSEWKENNITHIKQFKKKNFENIQQQFKKRTLKRMMTISTCTFTLIDVGAAAISSIKELKTGTAAFLRSMFVKINIVGVGRLVIAVTSDVMSGLKKKKAERKYFEILNQMTFSMNTKIYYKNAQTLLEYAKLYEKKVDMYKTEKNMWIAVEKTDEAVFELYREAEEVGILFLNTVNKVNNSFSNIGKLRLSIEEKNPGLVDEILRRIKE